MRSILLFVFLYTNLLVVAQDRCATENYLQTKLGAATPEAKAIREAERLTQRGSGQRLLADDAVIRIPVVVHVLYNSASQNISDVQIRSGMEALNRDFRRKAADTVNTPARFRALAADVQIEFSLALSDPAGRATTGIVRKQTSRNLWMTDDRMKFSARGGDDAWDSKSYLNIWIVNLASGGGYASVPGSAAATDGVVIHYRAFGTVNTSGAFSMGRTAVHEVGHWLGLKHIWGDTSCGDDNVDDTPQQSFFTKGCPSGFRSTCNNGQLGDMYMNFMDYTDDACMNLFTRGQRSRMRAQFAEEGWRVSILKSKGLDKPNSFAIPLSSPSAALYPNPASDQITVNTGTSFRGKQLGVYNGAGQLLRVEDILSPLQSITVADLKAGVYFLKGEGFLQKFVKL